MRFCFAATALICLLFPFLAALAKDLVWEPGPGFRSAALPVPGDGKTGFTRLAGSATGIQFANTLSLDRAVTNSIYQNGSGVALGDVDGDGLCDIYFGRLEGGNVLYKNLGNWKFQDVTAVAGVACQAMSTTGAVFADVDGDGDLDLLVNAIGRGTTCFLNDGKGHFTETTDALGLRGRAGSTSMALADVDGDGDLDLYVVNYRSSTLRDEPDTHFKIRNTPAGSVVAEVDGKPTTDPDLAGRFAFDPATGIAEYGEADILWLNDGHGKFAPVPWDGGRFLGEDGKPSKIPYDWGLAAVMRDLNGDGFPDIYVCNDFFSPDRVWINDGKGFFKALPRTALRQTSHFSMGVDVGDLNRDGVADIVVVDMLSRSHARRMVQAGPGLDSNKDRLDILGRPQYMKNTLQLGRGDGTFAEIAHLAGLESSDWSWNPVLIDVDLDGYEDLLVSNGFLFDGQNLDMAEKLESMKARKKLSRAENLNLRRLFPTLKTPNCAFRNKGDLTFAETGQAWGFAGDDISQGMALADLDNDGDLDVVVNNLNSPAGVFRNDSVRPRIEVRLKGMGENTRGIGARIEVVAEEAGSTLPRQSQEMVCGGRYLSGDDSVRTFATGDSRSVTVKVAWRGGKVSQISRALPNRIYEIDEEFAAAAKPDVAESFKPWFADASDSLRHKHEDQPYDDFARQPLLPHSLSGLGPGVAWLDLNGDGWDDLVVGSGKGGRTGLFLNDGKGGFKSVRAQALSRPSVGDQTGLVGWSSEAGGASLLVGCSNYEGGVTNGVARFEIWAGGVEESAGLPADLGSVGPMAMGDIDGDGDLDLFVGQRVHPGKFPQAPGSALYRNEGGKFNLDGEAAKVLANVGMVSGAVFSDLDGDGYPELLLATDWGAIRIFWNSKGKLTEDSSKASLNGFRGRWNGIAAGDFDGDGKMDIVASNWGRNTKYQASLAGEARLWHGDLEGRGVVDVFEGYQDSASGRVYPWRDLKAVRAAIPPLAERFATHQDYANASLAEIFGDKGKSMAELRLNTLDSMLFLNRGDHFEARSLPVEAQFAPAFGVSVADLDGDGKEDVFLSQNFFGVEPSTPRYDAGRGLCLRGDGAGNFSAVSGQASGVLIYGEQRGSSLADFDGDGRVDIVVAQNSGATRLLRNQTGRPGLRVRLRGLSGNTTGLGAILRLGRAGVFGPARELHAGSGYWSQDSSVPVMSLAGGADEILVQWPGGKRTKSALPVGAKEVRIGTDGSIEKIR